MSLVVNTREESQFLKTSGYQLKGTRRHYSASKGTAESVITSVKTAWKIQERMSCLIFIDPRASAVKREQDTITKQKLAFIARRTGECASMKATLIYILTVQWKFHRIRQRFRGRVR